MPSEEAVEWRALVVGEEPPELFENAVANYSQGWMPEQDTALPLDIVIGLRHEAKLARLEIVVFQWMAPKEVEVRLGEGRDFEPLDYLHAKEAKYFEAGNIVFNPPSHGVEGRKARRRFMRGRLELDKADRRRFRYIWLTLHEPEDGRRICITDLKIFARKERFPVKCSNISDDSDEDEDFLLASTKKVPIHGGFMEINGMTDFEQLEKRLQMESHKANKEKKPIRESAIQRALRDLGKCHSEVFQLRTKYILAKVQGDGEEADSLDKAMVQTMQNFYRTNSIHLLLFGN